MIEHTEAPARLFETWERDADDRTRILLMKNHFGFKVVVIDELSMPKHFDLEQAEAKRIAKAIQDYINKPVDRKYTCTWTMPDQTSDTPDVYQCRVLHHNEGEPYREGLLINITRMADYSDLLYAPFGHYEAKRLSKWILDTCKNSATKESSSG